MQVQRAGLLDRLLDRHVRRRRKKRQRSEEKEIIGALRGASGDPLLHRKLGLAMLEHRELDGAIGELRTAKTLGADASAIDGDLARAYEAAGLPQLAAAGPLCADELDALRRGPLAARVEHNAYYRFDVLARTIDDLLPAPTGSVLDVGGGKGILAQFLPNAAYCLADPYFNGMSDANLAGLPGSIDGSFDVVTSCSVIEHVAPELRGEFLDRLCAKASQHVVLLNPCERQHIVDRELIQFIIDITDEEWAKEHLDCGLPSLDSLRQYAVSRGLACEITPIASLGVTLAMVFVEHYARLAGRNEELARINEFVNTRFRGLLDGAEVPTAHVIRFTKQSAAGLQEG